MTAAAPPLLRTELALLAHATWVVLPATLAAGAWALFRFVRRDGLPTARYVHAFLVVAVWLVVAGFYDLATHHPTAVGGPPWTLDAGAGALLAQSGVGLALRHTRPARTRTARLLAWHLVLALATTAGLLVGLWPYR
jgi:hypothetical protein